MERISLNSALALCNSAKATGDQRSDLIAKGRILVLEEAMRCHNDALRKANRQTSEFSSNIGNANAFEAMKQKWGEDAIYFCAEMALPLQGKTPDRDDKRSYMDISLLKNPVFMMNLESIMDETMFVRHNSGVVSDVQYSITPPIINELFGEMVSVIPIPKGKTGEVEVTSNAVFKWYDSSWTSLRSVPQDQLYNRCVTLNPAPKATRFRMNFYQMIGNAGSLIDTMAAVSGGYGAMMMGHFADAFLLAAADSKNVPPARKATSYSDQNWATVVRNTAAVNRVRRDQLIAWGDFLALRKVLPDNATLAPAIMTMIGDEYFKNGYLMSHDGVMLYELTPVSTPETINTTMTSPFPTDTIVIGARANRRYAPMVMGMEEGGEGRIELTPDDNVQSTGWIQGLSWTSFDIQPAFASGIGLIENV